MRYENVYLIDFDDLSKNNVECLVAMNVQVNEIIWIQHNRLGYISIDSIARLIKRDLLRGLSRINFEKNKIYDAYQLGKQIRPSFKPKNLVSTTKPL